jgi:D-arabinose 1-dehydrogenase-like Zn-dependent alcohol dehydrogenase
VRGVLVERFGVLPVVTDLPDPVAPPGGVVVRVEVTGLCRSDVHGWLGHDPGIRLPHVPGHELVGIVDSVGTGVTSYAGGERVTTPFVCACGRCPECRSGNAQVCRAQTQPGFTHWGSYAERVVLHDAEVNLVAVPPGLDPDAAALLGCRFATAYRGLVHQAAVTAGERVLVVGCGGVGLSSVMIVRSAGARVLAVDVSDAALAAAARFGADETVSAHGRTPADVVAEVRRRTGGEGVAVSVDARGSEETLSIAIRSLAPRGRHVQIGLLAHDPVVPMPEVVARELTLLGTHGMAAAGYPELLESVRSGALRPQELVEQRIGLDDVPAAMAAMARDELPGVTVVDLR